MISCKDASVRVLMLLNIHFAFYKTTKQNHFYIRTKILHLFFSLTLLWRMLFINIKTIKYDCITEKKSSFFSK